MKSFLLEYKIKPGMLDLAKDLIRDMVRRLQNEEDVLMFSPFQHKQENGKFVHIIVFIDAEASDKHLNSDIFKKFLEDLATKTIVEPKFSEIEYIESDGE
jgi:quinol monooxygenase YgiN